MVAKQQPQPAAPAAAGYADGKVPLAASTAAAAGTKAAAKGLPSPKAPTAAAAAAASAGGGSGPAPGAAHQAPAAVPAVAAASAPGAKPAVSRSSSLAAAHGNNASRRLQALLASEELSSLSVLDAEGSELPGSRPPAKLHGALDEGLDENEQQEIDKIISEIHGTVDNADDGEDGWSSATDQPMPRPYAAAVSAAAAAAAVHTHQRPKQPPPPLPPPPPPPPQQQQQQQQHGAADAPQQTHAPAPGHAGVGRTAAAGRGVAAANAGAAVEAEESEVGIEADREGSADASEEEMEQEEEEDPEEGRQSAPAIVQQWQQQQQHGSLAAGQAAVPQPKHQQQSGKQPLHQMHQSSSTSRPPPAGNSSSLNSGSGPVSHRSHGVAAAVASGRTTEGVPDEAIATQLAQLHEESRRLQVQSQVLQQRAMAMSVRMSNSGTCPDEPTDASNTAAASTSHYLSSDTDAASPAPAAAIVPLSQVTDLQAAMAGVAGSVSGSPRVLAAAGHLSTGMSEDQYAMPASQANSVIAMSEGEAEHYLAQLQAAGDGGGLVPPDGMLPCHPPGDVTPSSVTSSRAGLHWNIPSRGSIPSPGKVDSRGSPRTGASAMQASMALHAAPALDFQAYTYAGSYNHDSSSHVQGPYSIGAMPYQLQQQQLQPQQQQHMLHAPPDSAEHVLDSLEHMPVLAGSQAVSAQAVAPGDFGMAHYQQVEEASNAAAVAAPSGIASKNAAARKLPVPAKNGYGISARVAAAGATAGRRISVDPGDGPSIGIHPAALAAAAAAAVVASEGALMNPAPRRMSDGAGVLGNRYAGAVGGAGGSDRLSPRPHADAGAAAGAAAGGAGKARRLAAADAVHTAAGGGARNSGALQQQRSKGSVGGPLAGGASTSSAGALSYKAADASSPKGSSKGPAGPTVPTGSNRSSGGKHASSSGGAATALAAAAAAAAATVAGRQHAAAGWGQVPFASCPPGMYPATVGAGPAMGPWDMQQGRAKAPAAAVAGAVSKAQDAHVPAGMAHYQQHQMVHPAAAAAAYAGMGGMGAPGAVWGMPGMMPHMAMPPGMPLAPAAAAGGGGRSSGQLPAVRSSGASNKQAAGGYAAAMYAAMQAPQAMAPAAGGVGRRAAGRQQQQQVMQGGMVYPGFMPPMLMLPGGGMYQPMHPSAGAGARFPTGAPQHSSVVAASSKTRGAGALPFAAMPGGGRAGVVAMAQGKSAVGKGMAPAAMGPMAMPPAAMAAMWAGLMPMFAPGMPMGMMQQQLPSPQQHPAGSSSSGGRWR